MLATAAGGGLVSGLLSSFTYWVESGRLLAGEHPAYAGARQMEPRVRALLSAGIDSFVDLTEEFESESYLALVSAAGAGTAPIHRRRSIKDMSVPSVEHMVETLDLLDASLETHRTTYLHCLAGAGRTGLVVGCHLVRHGMDGGQALKTIARLRAGMLGNGLNSPVTDAQRDFVLDWTPGK